MGRGKDLTDKQAKFCDEYLGNGGDASAAYRLAYPTSINWKPESVHRCAHQLLKNTKVVSRVSERQAARELQAKKQFEMDNQALMEELVPIVRADIGDLFDENGYLLAPKDLPDHIRRVVSEFVVREQVDGETLVRMSKIKLVDKLGAIEKVAKHIGFYREDNDQRRPEVSTTVTVQPGPDGRDELIERLGRLYPRPGASDEVTVQ